MGKIAPRGWFPGGSKKWRNTAGQYSVCLNILPLWTFWILNFEFWEKCVFSGLGVQRLHPVLIKKGFFMGHYSKPYKDPNGHVFYGWKRSDNNSGVCLKCFMCVRGKGGFTEERIYLGQFDEWLTLYHTNTTEKVGLLIICGALLRIRRISSFFRFLLRAKVRFSKWCEINTTGGEGTHSEYRKRFTLQ